MVEGPYRDRPSRWPWTSVCALFLLLLALYVWVARPDTPQAPESVPEPVSVPDAPRPWEKEQAALWAGLEALADRLVQPTLYRYLDPKPLRLRASRFADTGDLLTGGSSACKLPDEYRRVVPGDFVYAHRSWPCHQLAEICYKGKCIRAIKATSGPFGCVLEEGAEPFDGCEDRGNYVWCVAVQPREGCTYRGQIDLGAAVANALDMDGIKTVRVRRIKVLEEGF